MTHGVKEKQAQCRFLVYIALLGFAAIYGLSGMSWGRSSGRGGEVAAAGISFQWVSSLRSCSDWKQTSLT